MKTKIAPENRTLEKRIADLEEGLKKQTRLTALAAVIAAILGSGGVAGILTVMYQKPLQNVEVQLKQVDVSQKELELARSRQEESDKNLQQIIDGLKQRGDSAKADAVYKILLQQEADFVVFCQDMNLAMQGLWRIAPNCRQTLQTAQNSAQKREEELAVLLQ